ncbi:MAG: 4'-phosphopantetheinyl transferase superfamily protein [Nitrospira sp.]|nr:MAG: 4'-phosphopantetheinyl transferase superfamily protein [Nitrospira sp.]
MLIAFQSLERLADTSRRNHIYLPSNTVHLWGIELDGSQRCLEQCTSWLDESERHRAARLVREDIRQRYVLAHGGLRAVLSRYLGVTPDVVALERSATGKPFLTRERRDRPAITFNLSHAHGRALIAVSYAQEVGVDLECVRSEVEVVKLSKRYFTRSEYTAIMQVPEEQRAARFFCYWVAKESLLKAQGIGLRGLSDCEVCIEGDGVDMEVRPRLGAQFTDTLQVRFLPCEKGWEAAVAAQSVDSVIQFDLEQQ